MKIERLNAGSILTPTGGFLKPTAPDGLDGYTHSLNPAIGCPFGRGFCGQFCYARVGMAYRFRSAGENWGDYLVVKVNAAELLRSELETAARRPASHRHHVTRLRIFASSATDPCAGPSVAIFRDCLRALADFPIRQIVIQTRSPLVLSLQDEILALADRATISFTIETDDEEIWRRGPAGSPGIEQRRSTFEQLRGWRVRKHLAVSPCLPLMDVERFAEWIVKFADDVTVDTFLAGDGAGGARTAGLPLPVLFQRAGWDWRDETSARELYAILQRRMAGRVGWSSVGFGRLGVGLNRPSPQPAEIHSHPGPRR